MAWYRTGTIAVTNGSATVTGTGTGFVSGMVSWGLVAPDGKQYEVTAVASATSLTIAPVYQGSTQTGQAYALFPTGSLSLDLAVAVQALISDFQAVLDGAGAGLFADGTVGLPGLAFASDADTGMRRSAANALALVTGGADRMVINTVGAVLTGLLSGTAVMQSATDATAGRLLTPGAFGLGTAGASEVTDANALTISGFYRTPSTWTGSPFAGTVGSNQGALEHYSAFGNSNYGTQVFRQMQSNEHQFVRHKNNGTWSAWSRVYNQSNILGTVSQTSGVPTGSAMQRASNANGEYVRLADGTQICTHTMASSSAAGVTWTYPIAFAAVPVVLGNVQAAIAAIELDGTPTTTTVVFSSRNNLDARRTDTCYLVAIGRWF